MLTPTGVTRAAYINAIKADAITHARLVFTTQGITLDDQDIDLTMGLEMDDILNGDTDMTFGKAVMKQLRVGILNSSRVSNLIWTDEFRLDIGVEISGSTKWVTVGTFIGEKPRNITNVSIIEYTANDRMRKFDVLVDEFWESLTFPKTLAGIYHALCNYIGVGYNDGDGISATLNRSFASAPAELQGYTCRDLLAWIAEACGCYARIDSTGVCKLVWFADFHTEAVFAQDDIFHIATADLNSGLTWDEFDQYTWDNADKLTWNDVCGYEETYSLDSLQVKQLGNDADVNYPQFIGGNVYLIVENPFLSVETYSDITTYIKPIWDRLAAFGGYLPINVDCIGNWLVETGDIISVQIDDTHTISVPLFCRRLVWRGACRDMYETTGNIVREEVVVGGLSTREKLISRNNIRLVAKDLYYNIQSGIEIIPDGVEISGGKYVDIKSGSSLKVESGGEIDINASGNLKLEGSTVEIKSGSTFDVDSNNFKIDSQHRILDIENIRVNKYGITYYDSEISTGHERMFIGDKSNNVWTLPYASVVVDYIPDEVLTNKGRGEIIFRAKRDFSSSSSTIGELALAWTLHPDYVDFIVATLKGGLSEGLGSYDDPYGFIFAKSIYGRNLNVSSSSVTVAYELDLFPGAGSDGRNDQRAYLAVTERTDGTLYLKAGNKAQYSNLEPIYCYKIIPETAIVTNLYYTNIYQQSSKEIKHNIQPMESKGEQIDKLEPVTFVYDDDTEEKERAGLIYEDTLEVMPEICTQDEGNKAINYMELVPILLKEIQDLRARVKALEEKQGG